MGNETEIKIIVEDKGEGKFTATMSCDETLKLSVVGDAIEFGSAAFQDMIRNHINRKRISFQNKNEFNSWLDRTTIKEVYVEE